MQIAVLRFFPDAVVTIEFTNRSPEILFSRRSFDWIQDHVNRKLYQQTYGITQRVASLLIT
jgi:hypothetical protein